MYIPKSITLLYKKEIGLTLVGLHGRRLLRDSATAFRLPIRRFTVRRQDDFRSRGVRATSKYYTSSHITGADKNTNRRPRDVFLHVLMRSYISQHTVQCFYKYLHPPAAPLTPTRIIVPCVFPGHEICIF